MVLVPGLVGVWVLEAGGWRRVVENFGISGDTWYWDNMVVWYKVVMYEVGIIW